MITLVELPVGKEAIIKEIGGRFGFKRRLESLNLRIGKKVKKISSAPFHGPVVIEVDGCNIALGQGMAKRVFLEAINEDSFNGESKRWKKRNFF